MAERFALHTMDVASNLAPIRFSWRSLDAAEPRTEAVSVVLLHGISSGAASWAACAAQLADSAGKNLRVVAWDAPGYGSSANLRQAAPTADDYARRLRRWLNALHVHDCVLVGHSLGALMAAAFARNHPERVQALLLASPAIGYGDSPWVDEVRQSRLAGLQKGMDDMAARLPDRLLSARATPAQRAQVRDVALQLRPEGYTQAVHMLCSENLYRYTALPAATQVCCGEHDVVTPPEQSRACAERLGAPFHLIAQAGHACPVEQPAALAHLIKELINDIPPV